MYFSLRNYKIMIMIPSNMYVLMCARFWNNHFMLHLILSKKSMFVILIAEVRKLTLGEVD